MSDIKVPRTWDHDGWNGEDGSYSQAYIELETGGIWHDATLKINGKPVTNCVSLEFSMKVGGLARATIELDDVPIRFKGRLEVEETASEEAQT